jgi:signal transduction histidine kinase
VPLNGEWQFYWDSFLETPQEISRAAASSEYIVVPGSWTEKAGSSLPVRGFAAYRLTLLLDSRARNLALMTGQMGTACSVHLNGERITQAGRPGRSEGDSQPAYQPDLAFIAEPAGIWEIVVRCSNFHHAGKSGFWSSIDLGNAQQMTQKWERLVQMDWFSMGSLLIMGLYHLGLYSLRRSDTSALWFGIFCLLISLRSLCVGTYFLARSFPVEWFWIPAKLDFLSFYIAAPVMIVFLAKIFPDEVKSIWVNAICIIGAVASVFVAAAPQWYYTQTLLAYEIILVVYGLYAIIAILRALKSGRQGAALFLAGFSVFFATIVNDILAQQLLIQGKEVAGFGLFVFVLCQAFLLSQRYAEAFNKVEHLSEELMRQEQMATVGNMASGIVHDLKNPAGIIKGCVEMANEDSIGAEERRGLLRMIDEEADRMLGLVQDLLDFSRGAIAIEKREVDAEQYLDRVKRVLERGFLEKRIEFHAASSVRGRILLDPDRFLRVLVNIGGNAADAMGARGRFDLRIAREDSQIVFSLKDSGPGIPEPIRATLFEPFVTHGKKGGTGLGMAITRTLVIAHGGKISFKTETGKGTEFTIALPAD